MKLYKIILNAIGLIILLSVMLNVLIIIQIVLVHGGILLYEPNFIIIIIEFIMVLFGFCYCIYKSIKFFMEI